jgi:hypothetical protein
MHMFYRVGNKHYDIAGVYHIGIFREPVIKNILLYPLQVKDKQLHFESFTTRKETLYQMNLFGIRR